MAVFRGTKVKSILDNPKQILLNIAEIYLKNIS